MICDRVILREQGYFVGDRWVFTGWLIETTGGQPLFSSPFLQECSEYLELAGYEEIGKVYIVRKESIDE